MLWASTSTVRSWGALREDAREDAYESLHTRLKDVDRALVQMRGLVAVQRSKRERAEGVIEALGDWMLKPVKVMKDESLSASFCLVLMCLD